MKHIAIFASGNGSNAIKIINSFQGQSEVSFSIFCNNSQAGIIEKASNLNIPVFIFSKKEFLDETVLDQLQQQKTNLIVLAGFLWLVPQKIIEAFPQKIINIHPALLPKFGGKGMYGMNVHKAVIAAKESESGITIHYIDKNYDEGQVILQAKCEISEEDTPESLQKKVLQLEHFHFPQVVKKLIEDSKG